MNFVAWIKVEHSGDMALRHEEGCDETGASVKLGTMVVWACPGCGNEAVHENIPRDSCGP